MPPVPPIPAEHWDQIPPAAQAAILALVQQYELRLQALQRQVDDLRQRPNQNATNSPPPPPSTPPNVKPRPSAPSQTKAVSKSPRKITRWQQLLIQPRRLPRLARTARPGGDVIAGGERAGMVLAP